MVRRAKRAPGKGADPGKETNGALVEGLSALNGEPAMRREEGRTTPIGGRGLATRQKLLQSALEVFEAQGYTNSPVALIAERAGVSQGTFYQYFRDRSHVIAALVDEHVAALLSNTELLWHVREGRTGLRRLMESYVANYAATAAFSRVWEEVSHTDDSLAAVRRKLTRVVESGIQQELVKGVREGLITRVKDTAATARALTAMADRFCYLSYVTDPASPPLDPAEAANVLTGLWANAIGLRD